MATDGCVGAVVDWAGSKPRSARAKCVPRVTKRHLRGILSGVRLEDLLAVETGLSLKVPRCTLTF